MDNRFFEKSILNSPYEYSGHHWELDAQGRPTGRIIDARRTAQFITPIPKPKQEAEAAGFVGDRKLLRGRAQNGGAAWR
jgi:type III restriction enzyme